MILVYKLSAELAGLAWKGLFMKCVILLLSTLGGCSAIQILDHAIFKASFDRLYAEACGVLIAHSIAISKLQAMQWINTSLGRATTSASTGMLVHDSWGL